MYPQSSGLIGKKNGIFSKKILVNIRNFMKLTINIICLRIFVTHNIKWKLKHDVVKQVTQQEKSRFYFNANLVWKHCDVTTHLKRFSNHLEGFSLFRILLQNLSSNKANSNTPRPFQCSSSPWPLSPSACKSDCGVGTSCLAL